MTFGLSTLGLVHTTLSLFALASGLIMLTGMLAARRLEVWTAFYFASALAATLTGFGFPGSFGVPHYLGIAALVTLSIAILGRYAFRLAGRWHWIYAVAAVASVYIFVFFSIGEAFLRTPALNRLAPTLTEVPFTVAQLAACAIFVALAIAVTHRFHPDA